MTDGAREEGRTDRDLAARSIGCDIVKQECRFSCNVVEREDKFSCNVA